MLIRDALPGELPAIGDLRVAAYQAEGFGTGGHLYTAAGFRRQPERDASPGVTLIAYGLEL